MSAPLSMSQLQAGMAHILDSPKDRGELRMILRRPRVNEREILEEAELDLRVGLKGDSWYERALQKSGIPNPNSQIAIMNARVIQQITGSSSGWEWAGDQLYLDLDLGSKNLPPGTRLGIGQAILEVTAEPHRGCKKFVQRFGLDAMLWVNSLDECHLRGIYAKVLQPGKIRRGDLCVKL